MQNFVHSLIIYTLQRQCVAELCAINARPGGGRSSGRNRAGKREQRRRRGQEERETLHTAVRAFGQLSEIIYKQMK